MKKFFLSIILAAGGLGLQVAQAQVGVNVGVRIGPLVINVHKPVAPAVVYDDFYYLPDVEAYYSVPEQCYYYMDGDRWVNARYLPGRYRNYDWRSARRYEVRAQRPYANHDYYRNRFGGNRTGDNWGNNDQYANHGYDRRNERDNDRRFPNSPYDSNNTYGRGGYNQPDRRNDDNRNNGGNWNRQRPDNNDSKVERSRGYGPDRNQGGYFDNGSNKGRGNDNDKRNDNNGQRDYGRPSNQDNGRGNRGRDNNRGNGNPDRGNQQRYTQNNNQDSRPPIGSLNRMSF